MKHIVIYLLFAAVVFTSCEKEKNHVFDKNPDERLQEKMGAYMNALTDRESGWLLSVNTKIAGGFSHWVKFDKNNRVQMLSDVELYDAKFANSATLPQESSFSIKSLQNIILSFDTYNYLHLLSDPEGLVNGGKNGEGLKSDFEFSFLKEEPAGFSLKGRYNGVKTFLVPCSAEQAESIKNGGLVKAHEKLQRYINNMRSPAIEYKSVKADVILNSRFTKLGYINKDNQIVESQSGSYFSPESLIGDAALKGVNLFDTLYLNTDKLTSFVFEQNNSLSAVINGEKVPVFDNKKSVLPLRLGYEKDYQKIKIIPSELEGTIVDPYLSKVFLADQDFFGKILVGAKLEYVYNAFLKEAGKDIMQISCVYRYKNSLYSLLWACSYEWNEDGSITFTDRWFKNAGAQRYEPGLRRILDYFCKVNYKVYHAYDASKIIINSVEPKTFKIDWAEVNTPGIKEKVGAFYPVTGNPADYVCAGILVK